MALSDFTEGRRSSIATKFFPRSLGVSQKKVGSTVFR